MRLLKRLNEFIFFVFFRTATEMSFVFFSVSLFVLFVHLVQFGEIDDASIQK